MPITPSLYCRSHLGCFLGNRVPGLIRWRWTGTRRPSSTISTAQSANIPEPSWLKRTTGCSVTPTALTCPTGELLSAVATTHRYILANQPSQTQLYFLLHPVWHFHIPIAVLCLINKFIVRVLCEMRNQWCIACAIVDDSQYVIWEMCMFVFSTRALYQFYLSTQMSALSV